MKFKYGAWYLDPKSWNKRKDDEPLENPKDIKDKEMSEAKKKSKELVSNRLDYMYFVDDVEITGITLWYRKVTIQSLNLLIIIDFFSLIKIVYSNFYSLLSRLDFWYAKLGMFYTSDLTV